MVPKWWVPRPPGAWWEPLLDGMANLAEGVICILSFGHVRFCLPWRFIKWATAREQNRMRWTHR